MNAGRMRCCADADGRDTPRAMQRIRRARVGLTAMRACLHSQGDTVFQPDSAAAVNASDAGAHAPRPRYADAV